MARPPMRDGEELLRELAKRMQPTNSSSSAAASPTRQTASRPAAAATAASSKPAAAASEVIELSSDDEVEAAPPKPQQPQRAKPLAPISMPPISMRPLPSATALAAAPAAAPAAAAASSSAAAAAASSVDRLSAAASSIVPAASAISLDSDDSDAEDWGVIIDDDEDAFERAMAQRKPPEPAARVKDAATRQAEVEAARLAAAQADRAVFDAFAFSDDEEEAAAGSQQPKRGPGRPRAKAKPAAAAAAASSPSPISLLALAQSQQLARMAAKSSRAQDELMALQLAMSINAAPDLMAAETAGRQAGSDWAARKTLDKMRRNITAWQKQDAPAPMPAMAALYKPPAAAGVAPEAGVTRSGLKRLRRPANAVDSLSDESDSGSAEEEEEDADGMTRSDRLLAARAARAAAAEDSAAQKEHALAALLDETRSFLSNIKQIAPSLLQQAAAAAMEPVLPAPASAAAPAASPTMDNDGDAQLPDGASAAAASSSSADAAAAAASSSSSAAASPDPSASRPRIEPSVAASAFCPLLTAPGALLKGYQISGVNWLQSLYKLSLSGGILADEMGLGKTVQTVAFLAWILHEDREADGATQKQQAMEQTIDLCDEDDNTPAATAAAAATAPAAVVAAPPPVLQYHPPHLVLVPLSTLSAWQLAFAHWCPSLRVHTHYSLDKDDRKRALKSAVRARGKHTVHVVLSTYDLFLRDSGAFLHFPWRVLVIDEATRLKNSETVFFQLIKELRARFRLLLTGTPLSNKLADLFSLLHFIAPSQFENLSQVEEMFSGVANQPIEPTSTAAAAASSQPSQELEAASSAATDAGTLLSHLHAVIRPFLLRRTKDRVIPLDHYLERFVPVPLSGHQQAMYTSIQKKGRQTTGTGSNAMVKSFQNLLMQMRKVSASPVLFKVNYNEELWADADRLLAAAGMRPSSSLGIHELNRLPPRVLRKLMESQQELISTSGKFWMLHNILPKLLYREAILPTMAAAAASGAAAAASSAAASAVPPSRPKHKLLIFSTFRIVLDEVAVYLDLFHGSQCALPLPYLQLDGTTPAADREEMLAEFNAPDSEYCIFLLTTRAGGMGINLQAASTVLLLDADWNPAADLQAIARAHRLGQTKQVLVLRMVAPGVEEYIMRTSRAKSEVEGRVIAGGQFSEEHLLQTGAAPPLAAHIAKERARLLQSVFQQDLADATSDLIALNDSARDDDAGAPNTTATQKPLRSSAATSIAGLNLNKLIARDADELEIFEQMDRDAAAAANAVATPTASSAAAAVKLAPPAPPTAQPMDEDDDLQVLDSKIVRTGSSSSSSSSAAAAAAAASSASTSAASLSPASFGPVPLQTAVEFPRWFVEGTAAAPTNIAPTTAIDVIDDDIAIVIPVSMADAAASASPAIASLLRGRSCKNKRSYTELRDSDPFSASGESSVAEQAQLKRALKLSSASVAKKPRPPPPPRSHLTVEGESDEEDDASERKPQRATPSRQASVEQFSCACGALFDDFSDLQVHTLCSCSLAATN